MKKLKNTALSFLILVCALNANAQNYDPAFDDFFIENLGGQQVNVLARNQKAKIGIGGSNLGTDAIPCTHKLIFSVVLPKELIIDSTGFPGTPVFQFDNPIGTILDETQLVITTLPWDPQDGTIIVIESKPAMSPCNFVSFPSITSPVKAGTFVVRINVKAILNTSTAQLVSTNVQSSNLTGAPISDNDITNNELNPPPSFTVTGVVPILLKEFTVANKDCNAVLKWTTTREVEFEKFEIEYSSDNKTFIKIAEQASKNPQGSTASLEYSLAHAQYTKKGYYRLKMLNKDGTYSYSIAVLSNNRCLDKETNIYPHPIKVNQLANITLKNTVGRVVGELFSIEGKRIQVYALVNGTNRVSMSTVPAGTYLLKVRDEEGYNQSIKISVLRGE